MEVPEGIVSEIHVHPLPAFPLTSLPPSEQPGSSIMESRCFHLHGLISSSANPQERVALAPSVEEEPAAQRGEG